MYDINHLKEFLGQDICSQLLFIHAVTGCDFTSRIFGVGAFQKLLKGDSVLRSCANASILPNQTMAIIDVLRCHAMAVLFGGNSTDSVATMQYNTFSRKVVTSSLFVDVVGMLSHVGPRNHVLDGDADAPSGRGTFRVSG